MANKPWINRIVGHANLPPSQVVPNDKNWRRHNKGQIDALEGTIDEIGFLRSVLVNKRSGHLIDGHLRLKLAIKRGEPTIPVEYVDLSPAEEDIALATHDAIGSMAETDQEALDSLLSSVRAEDSRLKVMLADLASAPETAIADNEVVENEPEEFEIKPPPAIVWILVGVPLEEYGSVREHVVALQKSKLVTVETNRDED